jgi:hypothetical protein
MYPPRGDISRRPPNIIRADSLATDDRIVSEKLRFPLLGEDVVRCHTGLPIRQIPSGSSSIPNNSGVVYVKKRHEAPLLVALIRGGIECAGSGNKVIDVKLSAVAYASHAGRMRRAA